VKFKITAYGHPLVRAAHRTTFEITTEGHLTPKGDCILAIRASSSLKDLPEGLKSALRNGSKIKITLECEGIKEVIRAEGGKNLTFTDPHALIIRKSDWQDSRTLAIRADKAACEIRRDIIRLLKQGKEIVCTLETL
jgi:hypothetical protein